jgi:transcriptional regulator with XRE-family HTH domain
VRNSYACAMVDVPRCLANGTLSDIAEIPVTTTLDDRQRTSLREADDRLARWQESLEQAAEQGAIDEEQRTRLRTTLHELVRSLNEGVAPLIDPEGASEIRDRLVRLMTLDPDGGQGPLDLADRALMEAEAIRHIVRDLLDGAPPAGLTTGSAVAQIEAWLPRMGVGDLARLLGVDRRTIPRLRRGEAPPEARVVVLWRLVALLRHSWTDEGVVAWFDRPRQALDGRTPAQLLDRLADEPELEWTLTDLARRGRTQRAA